MAFARFTGAAASPLEGALAEPYKQQAANSIYSLLFCDDLQLFRPAEGQASASWQSALFAAKPHAAAIKEIAENPGEESRIRILAYNWLRAHGHSAPARQLLGVIVEVPLEGGLDVLAAYQDGRVRYINQTGKITIFEAGPPQIADMAREMVSAAQLAVSQIGPWDKNRLPPPVAGMIRLTFLVSDGLYFGEGPFDLMSREALAAPIIQKASELLQLVVSTVAG